MADGQTNVSLSTPAVSPALAQARRSIAAQRTDIKVTWNERQGVPLMIQGKNLLQEKGAITATGLPQKAAHVIGALAGLYGVENAAREFVAGPVETSPSGYQHVRMNQRYNGLPVVGAQIMVHFDKQGAARVVNGLYQPISGLTTTPVLSALEAAAIGATDQAALGNPAGTLGEGPALVIFASNKVPVLAYQFLILYDAGNAKIGRWRYWVDANTGAIILRYNDLQSIGAPSSGAAAQISGRILFEEGGEEESVDGWRENNGIHYLWSFANTWFIYDANLNDYAYRTTNTWGVSDRIEMSAARNVEATARYYRDTHGRNSIDGAGMMARADVHNTGEVNAYWDGNNLRLILFDELPCALDVCGHEFTHGVTQYTADLIYYSESGALNESFSDIFGVLVEFYLQPDGRSYYPAGSPGKSDWLMGEDTAPVVGTIRDMRAPRRFGDPSRYKGSYWYSGTYDNAGVHWNSGVQNHFFYLLCEGGVGNNDGITYSIPGIGTEAGGHLAYLALTKYCGPSTDYIEAREAWLAAAQESDEAGLTTNTVYPVMAAWAAVGIGFANAPIVNPAIVHVMEGSITNVGVTLSQQPGNDVEFTVAAYSGSTNLYLIGSSNLTFTSTNWNIPQPLTIGSFNDTDTNHDVTIFKITSLDAGIGSMAFSVIQMDLGDTLPPQCVITGEVNEDRTILSFDFMFDEEVTGFIDTDILMTHNIAGGLSFKDFRDITGEGRHFLARYDIGDVKGSVQVTVPAGRLTDQSANANPNPHYSTRYTIPWVKADFSDNFEHGSTWTRSTNVYAGLISDIWSFGPPVFSPSWAGPANATSGTNCWGVMNGPYGLPFDGWVLSPTIAVGAHPVLNFQLWMWTNGVGYVEVKSASGWVNVSPGGFLSSTEQNWKPQAIALDDSLFGNRTIQVRFRAENSVPFVQSDSAIYIDDVVVESQRDPAVWLVSESPTNGPAGANTPVSFVVYNSTTTTLSTVMGAVSSSDAGVSIVAGSPASYGTIVPGGVVTSGVPVTIQLAAAGNFDSPDVALLHHFTDAGVLSSWDQIAFTVDGVTTLQTTNLLFVKSSSGVTNWLGQRLAGNGNDLSCLFQVIYSGSNGVADLPTVSGQVTGDDRILYSSSPRQAVGRFGEGAGVVANMGTFSKLFGHSLASNALVYVRAWDAASFEESAAYGNSSLYAIKPQMSQTNDFGSWVVGTPAPGSFVRDSNGDSIPDGWSVLAGMDPRQTILPLGARVISAKAITDVSYPNRVAVSSNYVFVADTENSRIQVWNRSLTNRWYMLGSSSDTNFSKPRGIAVSRDGSRVAVADTANRRVRVFSVNPTNGVLTSLFMFGSYGTGTGQFNDPMAVAFGAAGEIYVADSQQSGTCNNRVQIFNASGVFQQTFGSAGNGDGEFNRLLGIGLGRDGTLYAADGVNNRVQAFTSGSSFAGKFGTNGTAVGKFNRVWDAQPGVGNLLYVADLYNNRIQVLNVSNPAAITVVGVYSNAGTLGAFNLPQSAAPAPDDNVLYVADTYNSRVLRLKVAMDSDGDGMDDVWEVLHGLNPNDPSDALADADGDGVLNIGEYRVGTDPQNKNTDGDGAGDGWEMANGLNPLVSNSVSGTIPTFVSLTVSPASPVRASQTVLITVTYSETITNAPSLTLSGAVALGPMVMAGAGTTWNYSYLVPVSTVGAVDGAISGAIGISGNLTDPPTVYSNALFTITGEDLLISAISAGSGHLAWNAWSGDVYQIQSSTNLLTTNWVDGVSVTSSVSGTLNVSNVFSTTNQVQFMRVLWLGVP